MAEREGFEPSVGVNPLHSLSRRAPSAVLGHLSLVNLPLTLRGLLPLYLYMAEGVGFEPTELSFSGFQDRRLKPLGHPSIAYDALTRKLYPPPRRLLRGDRPGPVHIGPQRLGDLHGSVGLLVILEHGHQRPSHREPGAVERMYQPCPFLGLLAIFMFALLA